MLDWLESTSIATWIQLSVWGYPFTLSAHAVGMAIVVGLTTVTGLRILGFPSGFPLSTLKSLIPIWLLGILLNASSGLALFAADANRLFVNRPFQIKILMIVIGSILFQRLYATSIRPAAQSAAANMPFEPSRGQKWLAAIVILTWWFSVILSGRLIAYMDL
ncbi:hypothetical protein [Sphingobium sp. CAP-1]|uniref:hypothetical protein n=1 Tax=Sphingobium sp. CAP-1 TaxID=2676077 RepID=UPI0012BB2A9F|nr:hypothetical protein [Sphingobium sp. CAP-1]QGP80410.1 hypothetical protein GL174_14810 [Sphingobium sp. CAP-1]